MNSSRKNSSYLKIIKENKDNFVRLLCFHYAGGGASVFNKWVEKIPAEFDIVAVQLPGRENRFNEEPHRNHKEAVLAIYEDFKLLNDKPYVIFGHSMGALLAYEFTKLLIEKNKKLPEQLFLAGKSAPSIPRRMAPIHHLPEDLFLEEISRYGGIPKEILQDSEIRSFFLPTLKADFEL